MRASDVIGILCADFHLSLLPPVWRSNEPNWFEAQKRPLQEIEKLSIKYDCPVFCGGDVFDRWNSCPELINFALENLPTRMYAVPGQHDLPMHKFNDIKRSAFWTLIKTERITLLRTAQSEKIEEFYIYGFSYGRSIIPPACSPCVAVAHQYAWIPGCNYPNAPRENKIRKSRKDFKGYDIVVFGDNHKGFLTKIGKTTIFNCGTIIRRKSDEAKYKPQVGLLLSSGEVKIHYLDTSQDKHLKTQKGKEDPINAGFEKLFEELSKLGDSALNFEEYMKRFLEQNKTKPKVKRIILKAMEVK